MMEGGQWHRQRCVLDAVTRYRDSRELGREGRAQWNGSVRRLPREIIPVQLVHFRTKIGQKCYLSVKISSARLSKNARQM